MKNAVLGICLCLAIFVAGAWLQGCATPVAGPAPALTFGHLGPFPVDVASVEVENRYNRQGDPQDASAALPVSLDKALEDYAHARLQPAGQAGTLRFTVENAAVRHRAVDPSDKLLNWTKLARKDFYEADVRIGMEITSSDGWKGNSRSTVNIRRNVSIPQSETVSEKDRAKFEFLEDLMADIDAAVTSALKDQIARNGLPQP